MWFKKIEVPETNELKEVDAIQLWAVRWTSRHGSFHSDTRPELEVFPSSEAAKEFAVSLRNAFRLLKHQGDDTNVSVEKY